jgi:hypothetical protein
MAKQADTDAPYTPPLTLTPALLNRVAAIAEALGGTEQPQHRAGERRV